ncbi:MAG: hypothetical protein R3C19_26695 [Planctomycetaceae bacterium]
MLRACLTFILCTGMAASACGQLKPGTPEWDRHFRELRERVEKSTGSNLPSPSASRLNSLRSSSSRSSAAFKQKAEAARRRYQAGAAQREANREKERQEELAKLPAKYRKLMEEAQNPLPFERDQAPSVKETFAALCKVASTATKFEQIVPFLAAPHRQNFVLKETGTAPEFYDSSEESLKFYRSFLMGVKKIEHSAVTNPDSDHAYLYVWVQQESLVLYQLHYMGEGKMWRLAGWEAQLIRN